MLRLLATALALSLTVSAFAQETRTVVDVLDRTVEVPVQAERITVLDPLGGLETALSLGIVPTQIGQRSFVERYLGDPLLHWPWLEQALQDMGADPLRMNADETDLEAVAAGGPDLIIGSDGWVERVEDRLPLIAPTIAVSSNDIRSNISLLGEALGREADAERVNAAWTARIENDLRPLTPEGATLAVIRTNDPGTITVLNSTSGGAAKYFADAGYVMPEEVAALPAPMDNYGTAISLEEAEVLASADVIVLLGFSPEPTEALNADPIFRLLPPVAEGRVVTVPQGPVAQAIAIQSPLNFDVLLELAKEVASTAAKAN